MKGVIRTIQSVLTIVWAAALALSVLLFMSARGSGLPGIGDWRGYVVADDSMSPELSPQDLAVIHMGAEPQPGDVVLSTDSRGLPELTRIIGTSEGQLILKADSREDSRLSSGEDISGVYAGYLPGFGEAFRFLCSLSGVLLIFAAGLVLVVLPGFMLRAPKARPERRPEPRPVSRSEHISDRRPAPRPERIPERSPRPSAERESPRPPRRGGYTPRH